MMIQDLDKVRYKVASQEPLLSYILYSLKVEEGGGCETLATDGEVLRINASFFDKLSLDEKVGVILHEIMHIVFAHTWQITLVPEDERNRDLFNLCADVVINKLLKSKGYVLPACGVMSFSELGRRDLDGVEMTTLGYYEKILRGGVKSRHSDRDIIPNKDGERQKGLVQSAVNLGRQIGLDKVGKLGGELIRVVDKFGKTETDWKSILRDYMRIVRDEEYTYSRVKERNGVLRPSLRPIYPNGVNMIIVVDSSGSISDETLHRFACEVYTLIRGFAEEIYLIVNDADITLEKKVSSELDIPGEFPGGGGTAMEKAFKRINDIRDIDDAIVVVITDGYISDLGSLKKPYYEVVWILVGGDRNFVPPFGRVVHILYH